MMRGDQGKMTTMATDASAVGVSTRPRTNIHRVSMLLGPGISLRLRPGQRQRPHPDKKPSTFLRDRSRIFWPSLGWLVPRTVIPVALSRLSSTADRPAIEYTDRDASAARLPLPTTAQTHRQERKPPASNSLFWGDAFGESCVEFQRHSSLGTLLTLGKRRMWTPKPPVK